MPVIYTLLIQQSTTALQLNICCQHKYCHMNEQFKQNHCSLVYASQNVTTN